MIIELNDEKRSNITLYMSNEPFILPTIYDEDGKQWVYKKGFKDRFYLLEPSFLDIETSWNHDDDTPIGWIYQWGLLYQNICIGGRKPSELLKVLDKMKRRYHLDERHYMVIYIHNASYDLQYLKEFIHHHYGECKLLAMNKRKILSFECEGFEFRCSYLLSNRSLAAWCDYTKASVKKAVGAVDYDLINYQDSRLDYNDWFYQINDIYSMRECFFIQQSLEGDTIATIPLTNTGYVRRDSRRKFNMNSDSRKRFKKEALSARTYILSRNEFRGALSGGNRKKAYKILTNNIWPIKHRDFKSMYPTQQMLKYAPCGGYFLYYSKEDTPDDIMSLAELQKICGEYCVLMRVIIKDLHIKKGVTCCYESVARCKRGAIGPLKFYQDNQKSIGDDNGRVLHMIGYTELCLNEIDLKWILRQYEYTSIRIEEVYIAERGEMPNWLKDTVQEYFLKKETLPKGLQRDKAKNNINSCYGMSATDIVRDEFTYDFDTMEWDFNHSYEEEDIEEKLAKYYRGKSSFMSYQYGCYTTAHARDELLTIISEVIGYERFIYCDTDSAFYYSSPEIEARIEGYNADVKRRCIEKGYHVTNLKGEESYYGTFEDECEDEGVIARFRFLHSKCYAWEDPKGKLTVTIAGVAAKGQVTYEGDGFIMKSVITKADELGCLENMNTGFTFEACGATGAYYEDRTISNININGHMIETASFCIITPTTKTLNSLFEFEPEVEISFEEDENAE